MRLQYHSAILLLLQLFRGGCIFQDVQMGTDRCPINLAIAIELSHPHLYYARLPPLFHLNPEPASNSILQYLVLMANHHIPRDVSIRIFVIILITILLENCLSRVHSCSEGNLSGWAVSLMVYYSIARQSLIELGGEDERMLIWSGLSCSRHANVISNIGVIIHGGINLSISLI